MFLLPSPAARLLNPKHSALPEVKEQLTGGRRGSAGPGDITQHGGLSEVGTVSPFALSAHGCAQRALLAGCSVSSPCPLSRRPRGSPSSSAPGAWLRICRGGGRMAAQGAMPHPAKPVLAKHGAGEHRSGCSAPRCGETRCGTGPPALQPATSRSQPHAKSTFLAAVHRKSTFLAKAYFF